MLNEVIVFDNTKALSVVRSDAAQVLVANRGYSPIGFKEQFDTLVFNEVKQLEFLQEPITINITEETELEFKPKAILTAHIKSDSNGFREQIQTNELVAKEALVMVRKHQPLNIINNHPEVSTVVQSKTEWYPWLNDVLVIPVEKENLEMGSVTSGFKALSIEVENSAIIESKPGTVAGGSFEELNFTAQLQSFMEFYLLFKDKPVDGVLGLPPGLEFNKSLKKISGSPQLAGDYTIKIVFEDDSILKGKIHVPKVKRDL